MHRVCCWMMAGCLALLGLAPQVLAQGEEAKAKTPWSGYWWPYRSGGLTRPLQKYAQYVGKKDAVDWEQKHIGSGAPKWFGYCHAWSASSVRELEPTAGKTVKLPGGGTLQLTVGDQKGLLAAIHARDVANIYGHRCNHDKVDTPEYQDLLPDQLWDVCQKFVKQGIPVVMDLEAGSQVWNYPVYQYKVEVTPAGGANQYNGTFTLWYADDAVGPDFIGVKPGVRKYTFTCVMKGGNIVKGSAQWTGKSVKDHPDFAWSPYVTRSENPHVDVAMVYKMLSITPREGPNPVPDPQPQPPPPMPDPSVPPPPPAQPLPPGTPPPQPTLPIAPGTVTISPAELVALIANRRSSFHFDITVDRFDGGKYKAGEQFFIRGTSQKKGYLYLLHLDKDGNLKLLYPTMPGQKNEIPANDKFEIGAPGNKDGIKFLCEAIGDNRVKGLVTSKPLNISGLVLKGGEAGPIGQQQQQQQALPIVYNPQQQQMVKDLLGDLMAHPKDHARVAKEAGADPQKVLGEFAQDEVLFYVGRADKDKPAAQAPPPKK